MKMIHLEWSVEQEVDFVYIVYFVIDMFGMGGLPQLPLHLHMFGSRGFVVYFVDVDFQLHFRRLLHRRYSTTSTTTPPLSSSTWSGMRGFLQPHLRRHVLGPRGFLAYLGNINIDLVDIDFRLRFQRLLHDVDRTPARGASSSTLSTLTSDFVSGIYHTDADWAVAQGASSSTSPTSTPASSSSTRTSSHALHRTRAFVTITGQEGLVASGQATSPRSMKSCPVIVTEGEEAANHHSTASKARPKQMEEKY
jgi:hypothetical protein